MALVQQPLLEDLRERPPHRLDVGVVERAERVVEIDPEPDPLGQPVPLLQIGRDRLAAALVELGDPEALDVGLALEAELLLDRDLDGEAVAVPARLARHMEAAHRLVARIDVLEHARQHVMGRRRPVRRRRALVEDPLGRALAPAQRLREDVALAPAGEHLQLELREGALSIDRAEHARDSRLRPAAAYRLLASR